MQLMSSRAIAAVAALLAVTGPVCAFAAQGGVRIIVQEWTPASPAVQRNDVVLDKPGLMSDALNQGWAKARAPVCEALKAEAGAPNLLAPGFSLYDIRCTMAPAGTLAVTGISGMRATIEYRLPGNTFRATSTQPTAAGSYADPCFMLSYDLSAKTTVHLDTLATDAFSVSVDNVSRPDSCNTAGDIAKFAATTVHFFGGPNFLAIAQRAMTRTQKISTADLNAALGTVSDPLRRFAGRYAVQQSWVRHGDLYFAFAPAYVPQPLSGALSGTIRMPKAQWFSAGPDCAAFSLVGTVQTGPAPIVNPESLAVGAAPSAGVGAISASGPASDAGDRFICAYTERQLPAGVPVAFRAAAKIGNGGHVVYPVSVKPDGWSGTEVVTGSAGAKNFVATVAPEVTGFGAAAKPGVRVDPGDPASRVASRVDTQTNVQSVNPLQRVGLNPQPLPPKVGDALTQTGNAQFAHGDFALAAATYGRAVDRDANNAIALHNLAVAHARLGQTDRAASELKRAGALARRAGDLGTARAADASIIIVSGSPAH